MLVFKFGGASVKSAEAVKNIVKILQQYKKDQIVVVVSAMGKTTNAIERIIENYVSGKSEALNQEYSDLKAYHLEVVNGLFDDKDHRVFTDVEKLFGDMAGRLAKEPTLNYDYDYDQLICFGELLSTTIIAHFLNFSKARSNNPWLCRLRPSIRFVSMLSLEERPKAFCAMMTSLMEYSARMVTRARPT